MHATRTDLSDAIDGYIICALWSSLDDEDNPLDAEYGPDDLAAATVDEMALDVERFIASHADDFAAYCAALEHVRHRGEGTAAAHFGHDLWLTRNGHGAGFWDRRELPGALGDRLTEAAEQLGDCHLWTSEDDGLVYLL